MNKIQRLASALLLLLFATGAFAQTAATAELRGTVKDPNGAVIASATVTIRDDAKSIERTVQTSPAGDFVLLSVPPGTYTLTVAAKGFSKMTAHNVTLTVGQAAQYPVTLQLAATETEITVTGEPLLVETARTSTSTTIGEQRIENLPINGRNYVNFSLTNSQV